MAAGDVLDLRDEPGGPSLRDRKPAPAEVRGRKLHLEAVAVATTLVARQLDAGRSNFTRHLHRCPQMLIPNSGNAKPPDRPRDACRKAVQLIDHPRDTSAYPLAVGWQIRRDLPRCEPSGRLTGGWPCGSFRGGVGLAESARFTPVTGKTREPQGNGTSSRHRRRARWPRQSQGPRASEEAGKGQGARAMLWAATMRRFISKSRSPDHLRRLKSRGAPDRSLWKRGPCWMRAFPPTGTRHRLGAPIFSAAPLARRVPQPPMD